MARPQTTSTVFLLSEKWRISPEYIFEMKKKKEKNTIITADRELNGIEGGGGARGKNKRGFLSAIYIYNKICFIYFSSRKKNNEKEDFLPPMLFCLCCIMLRFFGKKKKKRKKKSLIQFRGLGVDWNKKRGKKTRFWSLGYTGKGKAKGLSASHSILPAFEIFLFRGFP